MNLAAPLATVAATLAAGRSVHDYLPGLGLLHLEEPLPFLALHRCRDHAPDCSRLISGEAAYLCADGPDQAVDALLAHLRPVLKAHCPLLLCEVWAAEGDDPPRPALHLHPSADKAAQLAAKALAATLHDLSDPVFQLATTPATTAQPYLGLELAPFWLDPASGQPYPQVLDRLRRPFALALRAAFHAFMQCVYPSPSAEGAAAYQALGPSQLDAQGQEADRVLAGIDRELAFLLYATPTNMEAAWRQFEAAACERPPSFAYRPLAFDPAVLKRRLFAAPVETVADVTVAELLREKQEELDSQITLLRDRGTPRFLPGSMQVFGGVSDELVELAQRILYRTPASDHVEPVEGRLDAAAFAARAHRELAYYRDRDPDFQATIEVRADVPPSLMVSGSRLLIGEASQIPRGRAEALLQHEVGTHLITRYNGSQQPLQLLACGLAGYDALQEGLAVAVEYLVGGLNVNRLRVLAGRVLAVAALCDGAEFIETFRLLAQRYGYAPHTAFTITGRIYRAGGLTKDAVYLRGLVDVLRFLRAGGDPATLLVGKIDLAHVPAVEELLARALLKSPALLPRYLDDPCACERLDYLRTQDVSVLDLLN